MNELLYRLWLFAVGAGFGVAVTDLANPGMLLLAATCAYAASVLLTVRHFKQ